ncbi:hypothetical protein [Hyphobacterium sp.]|jgi:hypothetical protein|uniref:hypothetical protein n=1 Tax=Hyphobacterium sp. TaxID=2004662 RepID=UPI003BA8C2EE
MALGQAPNGSEKAHLSYSTFLEAELFAAALANKFCFVIDFRTRETARQLDEFLVLFQRLFGNSVHRCRSYKELKNAWADILFSVRELCLNSSHPSRARAARFVDMCAIRRQRDRMSMEASNPKLRFLGGWRGAYHETFSFNHAFVAACLREVRLGKSDNGNPISYLERLSRLWVAIRDLGALGECGLSEPSTAALWDQALGLWAISGSWYGLHYHSEISPLAAVQSQIHLRRSGRVSGVDPERPLLGARASALHSIAQRAKKTKVGLFRLVVRLVSSQLEGVTGDRSGSLLIRGNARLQLARVGHPLQLLKARQDLAEALAIRESLATNRHALGEAKVDYGFALALTSIFPSTAFGLIKEGINDMRASPESVSNPGFLVRALRKSAFAFKIRGDRRSRETNAELESLVASTHSNDQSPLKRLEIGR